MFFFAIEIEKERERNGGEGQPRFSSRGVTALYIQYRDIFGLAKFFLGKCIYIGNTKMPDDRLNVLWPSDSVVRFLKSVRYCTYN